MPTFKTMDGAGPSLSMRRFTCRWDRVDQMQVTAAVLGDTVLLLRGVLT
jgi:hypothetical protein